MTDDIQTVQIEYAEAMEMLWRQSQTIKRLQLENEKLRAAVEELTEENRLVGLQMDRMADEIEKLRAALKPFADKEYAYEGWADTARDAVWFDISNLRAAAAALKETDND